MKNLKQILIILSILILVGCKNNNKNIKMVNKQNLTKKENFADTVVYGSIYTSNKNQDLVESFAIKNGKYIYVGNIDGVKEYIGNNTKVINIDEGMVMAGATEGHGHYVQKSLLHFQHQTRANSLNDLKLEIKKYIEEHPDKNIFCSFGFVKDNDLEPKTDINYAKALDEVCADKPIICIDTDGHQAICNTLALNECCKEYNINIIDNDKGQEDKNSIHGGVILRLKDGTANGYLRDQAAMKFIYFEFDKAITDEECEKSIDILQQELYSRGFTNYYDAYINNFGTKPYKFYVNADNDGKLKINIYPHFGMFVDQAQNDENIKNSVDFINQFHKNASKHVLPCGIKLFADGVTESQTGLIDEYYPNTNTKGVEVFSEEQIYKITKYANNLGIGIHTHTFGNVAVNHTINAYEKAQNEVNNGTVNTLGHARNVFFNDYKRLFNNKIIVAENINWHTPITQKMKEILSKTMPEKIAIGYPIKTFLDNNVTICSSTDAPADGGDPNDTFGIIESAVNTHSVAYITQDVSVKKLFAENNINLDHLNNNEILNENENVDIKTAIDIMTINGAKMMEIDKDRGSIEIGKYADFLVVNKNILTCDVFDIHNAYAKEVYFEGEKVYEKK